MVRNESYDFRDFNTVCITFDKTTELPEFFEKFSHYLEDLHNQGLYITDMDPSKIEYDKKHGAFRAPLRKSVPDERNSDVMKNIYQYIYLLERVDIFYGIDIGRGYGDSIRKNNASYYYHDYIENLERTSGNDISKDKVKLKATPAGILYSSVEEDNNVTDYSKAAFISVPVVFVMAIIIALLMIVIFLTIK